MKGSKVWSSRIGRSEGVQGLALGVEECKRGLGRGQRMVGVKRSREFWSQIV